MSSVNLYDMEFLTNEFFTLSFVMKLNNFEKLKILFFIFIGFSPILVINGTWKIFNWEVLSSKTTMTISKLLSGNNVFNILLSDLEYLLLFW